MSQGAAVWPELGHLRSRPQGIQSPGQRQTLNAVSDQIDDLAHEVLPLILSLSDTRCPNAECPKPVDIGLSIDIKTQPQWRERTGCRVHVDAIETCVPGCGDCRRVSRDQP